MITTTPTMMKNRHHTLAMLNSALQHIDNAQSDLRRVGVNIGSIDECELRIKDMISDVEFREVI